MPRKPPAANTILSASGHMESAATGSDFAWEFLRRNVAYRLNYNRDKSRDQLQSSVGHVTVVQILNPNPVVEKWGLHSFR